MSGNYVFYRVNDLTQVIETPFSILWDIEDYGAAFHWDSPYSYWIGDSLDGSVECNHQWVDTGFRKTWCKHCNANGPA